MPRRSELTHAQILTAARLPYRQAKAKFHISHARWEDIKEAGGFEDHTGGAGCEARSDELAEHRFLTHTERNTEVERALLHVKELVRAELEQSLRIAP